MKTLFLSILLLVSFLLMGCRDKGEQEAAGQQKHTSEAQKVHRKENKAEQEHHEGHGHDHGTEAAGASFEAGKGIRLQEETRQAIKLETAEVSSQKLQSFIQTKIQVYRSAAEASTKNAGYNQGYAYATTKVTATQSKEVTIGTNVEISGASTSPEILRGKVIRIDQQMEKMTGQSELLIEIPDAKKELQIGQFLEAHFSVNHLKQEEVLTVPISAILKSAAGIFVYVVNGEYYFRTPIQLGKKDSEKVEIKEGLYEGDIVVIQPVERLWLIELRAVKGGVGCCH